MKNRSMFMICILGLFVTASVAQAGLRDPPILNHSFEWVEGGTHPTTGWGYEIDDWFEYPDSDISVFWEAGDSITLPDCDGDLWVGFQTGGTVYQAVGTVDDGATYVVTALIGDRPDDVFGTGALSLYASSSEDDGADDVELASFATLLDSIEVTMDDGVNISENINEIQVQLSVGTGHDGQILWLQVEDVEGKDYFDNIRIAHVTTAYGPDPANNAITIPLDKVFSWSTAPDPNEPTQINPLVINHLVYMSSGSPTDPNMVLVATVPAGSPPAARAEYDPPVELTRDGVYWWRVDEDLSGLNDDIQGAVWTFAAVTSKPVFEPDIPADVYVNAGENVTFAVSTMNPYSMDDQGMTYEWKKVGDPGTVLSTTTTLDITDAQITTGEGQYYCSVTVVDPPVNKSANSRIAVLIIKRLAGHWPFDRSLEDVVGGNDADYTGTKDKYDTGILENAIDFVDTDSAVTIPVASYINKSWALTWWDNAFDSDPGTDWESMIASGSSSGYELLESDRVSYYDSIGYDYATGFNTGGTWLWPGQYLRGLWHHHALSYDRETGSCSWYIDVEKVGEMNGIPFTDFDPVLYVGNCKDGTQPYHGMIDDLRFYNYPIDAYTVANIYVDITGIPVCYEQPEFDFTGDCRVNVEDLAVFFMDWMKCNLYPTCIN